MTEEESEPDCRVWYAVVSNGATLYPSEDAVISSGSQRCFDATEGMELSEVLGEIMGHHPSVVVCVLRGAKTKGWYPIADTRSASTVMKKGRDIFMKLLVQAPLVRPAEGVATFAVHQRYAKELAGARLQDGLLHLPSGFRGVRNKGTLWFHPNYGILEKYIEKKLRGQEWQNFHVIGTPGIGKSYFSFFWLHKLAQAKKKVVSFVADHKIWCLYDFQLDDPLVKIVTNYYIPPGWDGNTTWLVVDGPSRDIGHTGPTLQCMSPDMSGYANFAKDTGRICHLEAWQMEDLVACKNALGLSFSDEDIKRRFEICGGLPLYVFSRSLDLEELDTVVRAAVGRVKDWERVVDCAGSCIKDPDVPDLLLHYKLEKDENGKKNVEKMHLEFGSSRIETLSLDSLQTKGQAHARRFFNHCQHIGWAGALAGKVYERHVLNELEGSSQGRKYKMRCLATGKIFVHEIRYKQVKRMVEGDESVQNSKKRKKGQHSNSLLTAADARGTKPQFAGLAEWTFIEPYASNQKAFDAIGLADLKTRCKVYQVTVAEEHPLSWSKLAEVIADFDKWYKHRHHKPPSCYELVFVVPEHMFHSIKEQKYLQDDGRRYGVQLDAMKRLKQVVISVPW